MVLAVEGGEVLANDADAARWLATLGAYSGQPPATPTRRWVDGWTPVPSHLAYANCVYGIYVREVQFRKWVADDVAALVTGFPGDIGTGSMPGGWDPFCIADTEVRGRGRWLFLYAGISTSTKNPRITQYFGKTSSFTRKPGGQSFHLDLAQLFGGPVDIRNRTDPPSRSVARALRGALSLNLETRMREMQLSYAQVLCPTCSCSEKGRGGGCAAPDSWEDAASCIHDNEHRLLARTPAGHDGLGARPLMNAQW